MVSEQDAASMEGPRAWKEQGTPSWCWQTISALQTMWKSLELDCERYLRIWVEAEEYKVWEKVPYDAPYGTKEKMLEQLALGDDAAARARVAIQAMPNRPRSKRGSTSADYLRDRIERERPDVLERMKRGEFTSIASAAREAGIKIPKSKRMVISNDNETMAKTLRSAIGPDEFRKFAMVVERIAADDTQSD